MSSNDAEVHAIKIALVFVTSQWLHEQALIALIGNMCVCVCVFVNIYREVNGFADSLAKLDV